MKQMIESIMVDRVTEYSLFDLYIDWIKYTYLYDTQTESSFFS